MIDDARAREQGLAVGDRSELRSSGGAALDLVVHGVFERPLPLNWLLGKVVVAQAAFSAAPPGAGGRADARPRERPVRGGASASHVPHAELIAPKALAAARHSENTAVLRLLYVLLALAVLVSVSDWSTGPSPSGSPVEQPWSGPQVRRGRPRPCPSGRSSCSWR